MYIRLRLYMIAYKMLAYLPQYRYQPPSYFCWQVCTCSSLPSAALLTVV